MNQIRLIVLTLVFLGCPLAFLSSQETDRDDPIQITDSFLRAVKGGDTRTVEQRLSNNVPVDARDSDGNTALILASENNQIETIKLLLQYGADIDAKGFNNRIALASAAYLNHREIVGISTYVYLHEHICYICPTLG